MIRTRVAALLCAAQLLPGCALLPLALAGSSYPKARTLDDLAAEFAAARTLARFFLPWLAPVQRTRIEQLGAAIERAIGAARAARLITDQRDAQRQLEAAIAAYRAAAGA